ETDIGARPRAAAERQRACNVIGRDALRRAVDDRRVVEPPRAGYPADRPRIRRARRSGAAQDAADPETEALVERSVRDALVAVEDPLTGRIGKDRVLVVGAVVGVVEDLAVVLLDRRLVAVGVDARGPGARVIDGGLTGDAVAGNRRAAVGQHRAGRKAC